MNRKQFLFLTAAVCSGCQTAPKGGGQGLRVVDAGPVDGYAAEGVYENFRTQGFFIVRKGGRLFAISAICTHRRCELDAKPDHSFHCPCHGSDFTPEGHVTHGPAVRDLPIFAMRTENGRVMVTVA
jgi:Rieske Fe-S protein